MSCSHPVYCEICTNAKTKLLCPACARSLLYRQRLDLAEALLHRDSISSQIQNTLTVNSDVLPIASLKKSEDVILYHVQKQTLSAGRRLKMRTLREQTDATIASCASIQRLVDDMKKCLNSKRTQLQRQRDSNTSARAVLARTEEEALDGTRRELKITQRKHNSLQNQIVSARALLCKEAATLAGLHRKHHLDRDSVSIETFTIGGSNIFSLSELHAISWSQFTDVMANIARLVVLSCHYLHVRLPAQIVLPFRDHPQTAILSPASSYESSLTLSRNVSSTPKQSTGPGGIPHARPLCADRNLSLLAKEDPNVYSRVVEAVCLLAWDISWLCRAQGIGIASDDWIDFMNIGKNLWRLLLSDQEQRLRYPTERVASKAYESASNISQQTANTAYEARIFHAFGLFSHGTAFNFLDSAAFPRPAEIGVSALSWSFSHPSKISDNLKALLQNEMSGLEWELLDHGESDRAETHGIETGYKLVDDRGHTQRHHKVKADSLRGAQKLPNMIDSAAKEASQAHSEATTQPPRKEATNGWTKLKSRGGF